MNDDDEVPRVVKKSVHHEIDENAVIIAEITLNGTEVDGVKHTVIGFAAHSDICDYIKDNDRFRYMLKEAFLNWLDALAKVQ